MVLVNQQGLADLLDLEVLLDLVGLGHQLNLEYQ